MKWLSLEHNAGMHLVNVSTILVFMVVQLVFFHKIASKQLDSVVRKKATILKDTRNSIPDKRVQLAMDAGMGGYCMSIKAAADAERKELAGRNRKYIVKSMLPVVAIPTVILLILAFGWRKKLRNSDFLGLILVLAAYSTELMFFFLVVRRRVFIGDWHIANTLIA